MKLDVLLKIAKYSIFICITYTSIFFCDVSTSFYDFLKKKYLPVTNKLRILSQTLTLVKGNLIQGERKKANGILNSINLCCVFLQFIDYVLKR